jgi:hypothetical protein
MNFGNGISAPKIKGKIKSHHKTWEERVMSK